MPYLSRIRLNPLRTKAQAMLRNPQVLHAAVLGCIPEQPVTERVLWRMETPHAHELNILALTHSRPSWESLVEQAGWPSADAPQALVRPYEPLLERIQLGRAFAFRLKANPTSSTKNPAAPTASQKQHLASARPRGVTIAHRKPADQLTWLLTRLDAAGCGIPTDTVDGNTIPAVRATDRHRLRFSKKSGQAPVILESVTFDGLLHVTDPTRLRDALIAGVGSGKAYGFGLLTLAPPQPSPET